MVACARSGSSADPRIGLAGRTPSAPLGRSDRTGPPRRARPRARTSGGANDAASAAWLQRRRSSSLHANVSLSRAYSRSSVDVGHRAAVGVHAERDAAAVERVDGVVGVRWRTDPSARSTTGTPRGGCPSRPGGRPGPGPRCCGRRGRSAPAAAAAGSPTRWRDRPPRRRAPCAAGRAPRRGGTPPRARRADSRPRRRRCRARPRAIPGTAPRAPRSRGSSRRRSGAACTGSGGRRCRRRRSPARRRRSTISTTSARREVAVGVQVGREAQLRVDDAVAGELVEEVVDHHLEPAPVLHQRDDARRAQQEVGQVRALGRRDEVGPVLLRASPRAAGARRRRSWRRSRDAGAARSSGSAGIAASYVREYFGRHARAPAPDLRRRRHAVGEQHRLRGGDRGLHHLDRPSASWPGRGAGGARRGRAPARGRARVRHQGLRAHARGDGAAAARRRADRGRSRADRTAAIAARMGSARDHRRRARDAGRAARAPRPAAPDQGRPRGAGAQDRPLRARAPTSGAR